MMQAALLSVMGFFTLWGIAFFVCWLCIPVRLEKDQQTKHQQEQGAFLDGNARMGTLDYRRGWTEGRAALRREMCAQCLAGDKRMQDILRALYLGEESAPRAEALKFLTQLAQQICNQ